MKKDNGNIIERVYEYYKFTKPNVWWLLVFTAFGSTIAAIGNTNMNFNLTIIISVILAVTAGTSGAEAISNYIDKDIDKKMDRTKNRAIPSGRINPKNALILGLVLTLISIIISFYIDTYNQYNKIPIITTLMIFGHIDYLIIYSLILKRRSSLNIILGGFSGAMPALIGFTAITKTITTDGILLAIIVFLWIPTHIWSLSIKFREDYSNAKIPMLPVITTLENSIRIIAISTIIMILFTLMLYEFGIYYTITASILGIIIGFKSIELVMKPSEERAWSLFKITSPYLAIIFLALIFETIIKYFITI